VARLRPGAFDWPITVGVDGRPHDVSVIPDRSDGSQDHIALTLASPVILVSTRSGLVLQIEVELDEHPYALLWRNLRAPTAPGFGQWDVFAIEPQSTYGYGVVDADPADLSFLAAGQTRRSRVSLTVATDASDPGAV
jgi:galactose mutarotase-like enzyme